MKFLLPTLLALVAMAASGVNSHAADFLNAFGDGFNKGKDVLMIEEKIDLPKNGTTAVAPADNGARLEQIASDIKYFKSVIHHKDYICTHNDIRRSLGALIEKGLSLIKTKDTKEAERKIHLEAKLKETILAYSKLRLSRNMNCRSGLTGLAIYIHRARKAMKSSLARCSKPDPAKLYIAIAENIFKQLDFVHPLMKKTARLRKLELDILKEEYAKSRKDSPKDCDSKVQVQIIKKAMMKLPTYLDLAKRALQTPSKLPKSLAKRVKTALKVLEEEKYDDMKQMNAWKTFLLTAENDIKEIEESERAVCASTAREEPKYSVDDGKLLNENKSLQQKNNELKVEVLKLKRELAKKV